MVPSSHPVTVELEAAGGRCRHWLSRVWATWFASRQGRVALLLLAVILISIADLAMTLTYAMSVGMMEVNPIAHAIMTTGSPLLVVLWKTSTAGLGISILYRTRSTGFSEAATWVCFLGMVMLLAHWISFNDQIVHCTDEVSALVGSDTPSWVEMTAAEPH
jgi:hypothetical protein